ncbi:heme ABC exporter ATP-binding protein CcmA [Pseudoxanthobacter sp.]|uniref:heme ABC exporter ATP-binding protein CcmA n=1 Tax=Pseudoxanthobacter sp. TaxID=1925742 RepID=UPI002FDFF74C
MSPAAGLVVAGLCAERGGRPVLEGVAFHVGDGTALAVTGANGTGKSTLLRAIAGLVRPQAGAIRFRGAALPAAALHYLGHRDALKTPLTVAANLNFWLRWQAPATGRAARAARLDEALTRTGLGTLADLPAGHLSAGQRRRLALARLIAVPRPLWLLDEPTASLDAEGCALAGRLMAAHLAGGGVIVAATHDPLPGIACARLHLESPADDA